MRGDASQTGDTVAEVVHLLMATYQWTVISEKKLTALAIDAALQVNVSNTLEHLVINLYTLALYDACRQTDDLELRERGYIDLFRYLYRAAHQRWPDIAEDATQRALLLVYQQIERCNNPAAFRSFALFKLLQAAKELRRSVAIDQPLEAANLSAFAEIDDTLTALLVRREGIAVLINALKRLPNAQRRPIFLKFFRGLNDSEIAEKLVISEAHVRILRFRGLERMRKDSDLREYFERASS